MTDYFPDPPRPVLDAAAIHQERMSRAYGDAIVGSSDLREAISAFEQALSGARETLDTMPVTAPTQTVLTAWRASQELLYRALVLTRTSATIVGNAVGLIILPD